jgi:hypothetical protein
MYEKCPILIFDTDITVVEDDEFGQKIPGSNVVAVPARMGT